MNTYWTADFHEGHHNIIKYCRRPFKSTEEQHTVLVRNFNQRVKPGDTVFHVGDFCFRNSPGGKVGEGTTRKAADWQADYTGSWIHVRGNHDGNNSLKTCIERIYIEFGGTRICLVHDPADADLTCGLNFVGHVHNAWRIKRSGKSILVNVGVDVWDFRPVTFDEIMRRVGEFKRNERTETKNEAPAEEVQQHEARHDNHKRRTPKKVQQVD
jgi:calcineurin-like phosphoesterase family protein